MAKSKTTTKNSQSNKDVNAGDMEVTVCRRREERRADESTDAQAKQTNGGEGGAAETNDGEAQLPERRQKVQRRRQIDPTTCERDYTNDEIEFMHALDDYKRANGRMFPTCSEILEVVRGLGYEKIERMEFVLVDEDAELVEAAEAKSADGESTLTSTTPPMSVEAEAFGEPGELNQLQ